MKRETYQVEYLTTGAFFDESTGVATLPDTSVESVLANVPETDFWHSARVSILRTERFTNEDGSRETWLDNGSEVLYTVYIGDALSLEDVKALDDKDHSILISNMEINGWDNIVKTRYGSHQPVLEQDIVIPEVEYLEKVAQLHGTRS